MNKNFTMNFEDDFVLGTTLDKHFNTFAVLMNNCHSYREASQLLQITLEDFVFLSSIQEPIYIITELMCHGSLLTHLRDGHGQYLGLRELVDIAAQVKCCL